MLKHWAACSWRRVHLIAGIFAACVVFVAAATLAAQAPTGRQWDRQSAVALLAYIDAIETHGLNASNYAPTELHAALNSGNPVALERSASTSFGMVARDLAVGHLRGGERGRYFIRSDTLEPAEVANLIDRALANGDVAGTLESLAPKDRQYANLRLALTKLRLGDSRERRAILTNLERWRWLPRQLGNRYLLVNIPEFQLRLVDADKVIASHRVIVGKVSTPTPQFRAEVTGVIFNPPWNVPQSIIAESVGSLVRNQPAAARARGYAWTFDKGNLRVKQAPGPENALGQLKLDMPNPFNVFIHDTASKKLFDQEQRALSHGCIRTQAPFDLAAALLIRTNWMPERIAQTVASLHTERAPLVQPVPVYVVYLTAVADDDGAIRYLNDPYKLDTALARQLVHGPTDAPALAIQDHHTECQLA